ncbi:MAG: hypothetical protein SGILL_000265 [Bacillariaceae sp.]
MCCEAASDSRRPPPPPPPPRSSNAYSQQSDEWQQQQDQNEYPYPNEYNNDDMNSELPYAEPPETSSSWYPAEEDSMRPPPPPREGDSSGAGWYGGDNIRSDKPMDGRTSDQPYRDEDPYSSSRPPENDATAKSSSSNIPRMPIHYDFPSKDTGDDAADERIRNTRNGRDDGNMDDKIKGSNNDGTSPATASARNDLLTRYWSTKSGKLQIMASSTMIGAVLGNFLGNVSSPMCLLASSTNAYMTATALIFWISTWFRTPLGELVRAMGLSILLVLQRSRRIRKTYPTWTYMPAALGLTRNRRGLRPFPPARNPWKYVPRSPRDPDFNMMFVLVSMAFVGSMVGGSLPVIPTWMGALAGAGTFAFVCTWQSPRGDLARSCGMRVVSAVGELWEIQSDLQIIPKATVVSSQVIDKAMILDRKHRVKDRFLSMANTGYEQASKLATQIHDQQRGGNGGNNDDNRDERPRDRQDDRRRDGPRRGRDDYNNSNSGPRDRRGGRREGGDDGGGAYGRRNPGDGSPPPPRRGRGNEYDGRNRGDYDGRRGADKNSDDSRLQGDRSETEPPSKKRGFWRR